MTRPNISWFRLTNWSKREEAWLARYSTLEFYGQTKPSDERGANKPTKRSPTWRLQSHGDTTMQKIESPEPQFPVHYRQMSGRHFDWLRSDEHWFFKIKMQMQTALIEINAFWVFWQRVIDSVKWAEQRIMRGGCESSRCFSSAHREKQNMRFGLRIAFVIR